MFLSTLPDLTPQDSHNLWYTARHAPTTVPHHLLSTHDPLLPHDAAHNHHPHPRDRDARRALLERTPLARLRHDEAVMDRRRANVAHYGTGWLKPPGIAKTLFQIREERREAEEHAEALRREQTLAAQMAEAEAEEMMEAEGEEGEEVDLDEDVPEGEGFGFDGENSEVEDETDTGEDEDEEGETENNAGAVMVSPAEVEQVQEVRAAEDRLRNMMARDDGMLLTSEAFDDDAADAREEMLEEDDLVATQSTLPTTDSPPGNNNNNNNNNNNSQNNADVSMGMDMDMDMDADLDGEIPDGAADEYEHTDSDEDVDESTRDISFVGRSSAAPRPPPPRRLRRSVHRSSLRSRDSMAAANDAAHELSELLSGEGSSFLEASPYPRRRG